LVQAAPALFAASAGMIEVVAISKDVAAIRVALLPMSLSELRTKFLP
jgi:hypothetical protein